MYPKFNQPLFALVEAITKKLPDGGIKVVDVGAAVGDTVLFLEANFPGKISQYLCVDGDTEFYSFQEFNLSSVSHKSKNVFSLLSDKEELVSAIDKKDPTTGSAIGETKEMSKTLDQILKETNFGIPHVIKIDIDGFDGKAIGGATETLFNYKPAVIFEWNTPLYNLVGNDVLQPFEVLKANGYDRFIWFSNIGDFLHIQYGFNPLELREMEVFSSKMYKVNGFHFDVIALHRESPYSASEIALINENKKQLSPF
jgi:FkbM family methyltransferase